MLQLETDNDGLPDIYYSNIDFLAAKRVDAAHNDDDVQVFHGNRLYRNLGDGTFEGVTENPELAGLVKPQRVLVGLTMTTMAT